MVMEGTQNYMDVGLFKSGGSLAGPYLSAKVEMGPTIFF